jgi:predicted ester cyclase
MTIDDRLFELWTTPPDERPDPAGPFREVYADPVTINGAPMPVEGLVARARALHAAFDRHEIEVVDRIEEPGRLAIAFRHRARHVGEWETPLGTLAPTGRVVTGLGIDLLTFTDGKISSIWVLADELQRILQVHPSG